MLTAGIKLGSRAAAWGITFYSNTATRGKFPGLALTLWHSRGWQCPGCTTVSGHMWPGHLAGSFVLCCCTRCFPCQQSSYFWLSQVSHECPAWVVCVKWHLHGPVSLNWWCSWDLEKKNTSKRVNSWVSKVMLYKVFLWEILYDHFAEVSCVSFSCKYEYALWIKTHLLLQQAPSYSVNKIESRIPLSSEGQWFYSVLISYPTVLGMG